MRYLVKWKYVESQRIYKSILKLETPPIGKETEFFRNVENHIRNNITIDRNDIDVVDIHPLFDDKADFDLAKKIHNHFVACIEAFIEESKIYEIAHPELQDALQRRLSFGIDQSEEMLNGN